MSGVPISDPPVASDVLVSQAVLDRLDELAETEPEKADSAARAIQSVGRVPAAPIRIDLPGGPRGAKYVALVPADPDAPVIIYRALIPEVDTGSGWLVTALLSPTEYQRYREAERTGLQERSPRAAGLDEWRDSGYPPQREEVLAEVRRLVESLDGGIDEASGMSLDSLIGSWADRWVRAVNAEHADHCARLKDRRALARQRLVQATANAEREHGRLDHLRADLAASQQRLTEQSSGQTPPSAPAPAATALAGPSSAHDWAEPSLLAGRGAMIGLVIGAILIVIGAVADLIAFRNVLGLVLSVESVTVVWVMAVGTTLMALLAAATLGNGLALRRLSRHLPVRHRVPWLPLVGSAAVWVSLGLALFFIRWQEPDASAFSITSRTAPVQVHSTIWQATLFLAVYLISGACATVEAERLHNPPYTAFRRLRKLYAAQATIVARADAEKDLAQAVIERIDEELQAQDDLRDHAIADRMGLRAEAANYARVMMAAMMHDPAKAGRKASPVDILHAASGPSTAAATEAGADQPPRPTTGP